MNELFEVLFLLMNEVILYQLLLFMRFLYYYYIFVYFISDSCGISNTVRKCRRGYKNHYVFVVFIPFYRQDFFLILSVKV